MKVKKKLVVKEEIKDKIILFIAIISSILLVFATFSSINVPEKYNECIKKGYTKEYCENNIK